MGRVKEGGRVNLAQSGFTPKWWAHATTHHCIARNIEVVEGSSAYFARHKEHCKAMQIPFGAVVEFMPTANPNKDPAAFQGKTKPGLFLGYHIQPGGLWSSDFIVVDFAKLREDPELAPGGCNIARTPEVFITYPGAPYKFPLAEHRKILEENVQRPAVEEDNVAAHPGQVDP